MRESLSHVLEVLGFHIFVWTFWLDLGIYLGGDALFLGKMLPELEVVFPVCGFGILLAFISQCLKKNAFSVPKSGALWMLIFMGVSTMIANFSLSPQTSIYFLVIWTIGFFVMSCPRTFYLEGADKQCTLIGSICLGMGIYLTTPQTVLSPYLLMVGMLWLLISLHNEKVLSPRYLLSYGIFGFLFLLQSPLFLGVGVLLWLTSNLWLGKRKRMTSSVKWLFGVVFGIGLLVFSFLMHGGLGLNVGNLEPVTHFSGFMFGAGEGQYLKTFVQHPTLILDPSLWVFPSSGFLLILIEKGLVGVTLFVSWLFIPRVFKEYAPVNSFLVFVCCLLTPLALTVESGILLLNVILFSHPSKNLESLEVIPQFSSDVFRTMGLGKRK